MDRGKRVDRGQEGVGRGNEGGREEGERGARREGEVA